MGLLRALSSCLVTSASQCATELSEGLLSWRHGRGDVTRGDISVEGGVGAKGRATASLGFNFAEGHWLLLILLGAPATQILFKLTISDSKV